MAENRFDIYRKQAGRVSDKNSQSQKDAMDRRFAQMGAGQSGESVKLERLVNQENDANEEAALAQISIAEAQNEEQKAEAQRNREFASAERAASQKFAGDQTRAGREYSAAENKAARGEARYMQQLGLYHSGKLSANDRKFNMGIAKMQNTLARQEFEWQKQVDEFNMKMAERIANQKDIFGRGGDFVTGWWKKGENTVDSLGGGDFAGG